MKSSGSNPLGRATSGQSGASVRFQGFSEDDDDDDTRSELQGFQHRCVHACVRGLACWERSGARIREGGREENPREKGCSAGGEVAGAHVSKRWVSSKPPSSYHPPPLAADATKRFANNQPFIPPLVVLPSSCFLLRKKKIKVPEAGGLSRPAGRAGGNGGYPDALHHCQEEASRVRACTGSLLFGVDCLVVRSEGEKTSKLIAFLVVGVPSHGCVSNEITRVSMSLSFVFANVLVFSLKRPGGLSTQRRACDTLTVGVHTREGMES